MLDTEISPLITHSVVSLSPTTSAPGFFVTSFLIFFSTLLLSSFAQWFGLTLSCCWSDFRLTSHLQNYRTRRGPWTSALLVSIHGGSLRARCLRRSVRRAVFESQLKHCSTAALVFQCCVNGGLQQCTFLVTVSVVRTPSMDRDM